MRYTTLGRRTGLRVSEYALGTGNFGTGWAWLRERAAQASTSFVPIIGPRNLAQLDDYLGALDVQLTPKQFTRLSDVSAIPLGVPHEATAGVRDAVQGGDASLVIQPAVPAA